MADVSIRWLQDTHECDTCGTSYADGASVSVDGRPLLELVPSAHCYGGDSWDPETVFRAVLRELGHSVSEDGA